MAKQLQLRRGTTAQHSTFTGAAGEVTVDTDKDVVVVHDGSTAGGKAMVKEADTAYTIATVNDFGTVPVGYTTVIVKDTDRGGVFNRIASTTANGGTIFAGSSGYSWVRQYSGAVNVKWFGAKGDAFPISTSFSVTTTDGIIHTIPCTQYLGTNDREAFIKASSVGVVFVPKGNYYFGEQEDAFNGINDIIPTYGIYGENGSILLNTRVILRGNNVNAHSLKVMSSYEYDTGLIPYPISTTTPAPSGYINYMDLRLWKFSGEGIISELHSHSRIYDIKTSMCANGYVARELSYNNTVFGCSFTNSWYHGTATQNATRITITDNVMSNTIVGMMCDISTGSQYCTVSHNVGINLAVIMKFENYPSGAINNRVNMFNRFVSNTIETTDTTRLCFYTNYVFRISGFNNEFSDNTIKDYRSFSSICNITDESRGAVTDESTFILSNNRITLPACGATLCNIALEDASKNITLNLESNKIVLGNSTASGLIYFAPTNLGKAKVIITAHTQNYIGIFIRGTTVVYGSSFYIDGLDTDTLVNIFNAGSFTIGDFILKNATIRGTVMNGSNPVIDLSGKTLSNFKLIDVDITHTAGNTFIQNTSVSTMNTFLLSGVKLHDSPYNYIIIYSTAKIDALSSIIENCVFYLKCRFTGGAISTNNLFKNNALESDTSSTFSNSSILIGNCFVRTGEAVIIGTAHPLNTASILAGNAGI